MWVKQITMQRNNVEPDIRLDVANRSHTPGSVDG